MSYHPVDVAWKIISLASQKGINLTHMQLQKLTYIAHGLSLAGYKMPLLSQPVTAWKYGPVIPSLYHEFKIFRSGFIPPKPLNMPMRKDDEDLLNLVVDTYGKLSGVQLSELTHMSGTPWEQVWNRHGGCNMDNAVISDAIIQDYYQKMLKSQRCEGL
ncbi:Panacea domain-containing protein [Aeromonas dhakensis]|uniref:Panacea domain-containing protein n=1 Tax=Aeromonas dhakensis TaxID=196024 RepID=UPI003BA0E114